MNFIALKPCSFGGKNFRIGDPIEGKYIRPERVKDLEKIGMIAAVDTHTEVSGEVLELKVEEGVHIALPVVGEDGTEYVSMKLEDVQTVFEWLQRKAEDATAEIKETESVDALYLAAAVESRKGVKAAIDKRIKELDDGTGEDEA